MHTQPELWTRNAHGDYAPTLAAAQAAGAVAMESVEANAEANAPGFKTQARAFILSYLKAGNAPGEQITDAAVRAGIVEKDKRRAMGPIYLGLARAKLIRKVGTCKRMYGHASDGGKIWGLA